MLKTIIASFGYVHKEKVSMLKEERTTKTTVVILVIIAWQYYQFLHINILPLHQRKLLILLQMMLDQIPELKYMIFDKY
jgi:hypothetical protein